MADDDHPGAKSALPPTAAAEGRYLVDIGIRADHVHDDRTVAMILDEEWHGSAGSAEEPGWTQRAYTCPQCEDRVVFGLTVQNPP